MESSARKSKDVSVAKAETRRWAVRRGSRQTASEDTVRASDFYSEWDVETKGSEQGSNPILLYILKASLWLLCEQKNRRGALA